MDKKKNDILLDDCSMFANKSIKAMLLKVKELNEGCENDTVNPGINNSWDGNVYTYSFNP